MRLWFSVGMFLLASLVLLRPANADCPVTDPATVCRVVVPQTNSDDRILATLSFPGVLEVKFAASKDGHYLYVLTAGLDPKTGGTLDTRTTNTKLYIFDVTVPKTPRQVSLLKLGSAGADQLVVRGNIAFIIRGDALYNETGSHIIMVDVRDPSQPKEIGRVDEPFQWAKVLPDGSEVILSPTDYGNGPIFFSLKDPEHPRKLDASAERVRHPFPWTTSDWFGHHSEFYVGTQLLRGPDLYVAQSWASNYVLDIFSTRPPPFEADRLRKSYADVAAGYQACVRKWPSSDLCFADTDRLENAGVQRLATESPPGLTLGERLVILNNYGFWLYRAHSLSKAISVLQTVTILDPARSVAWLNLGDALREAIFDDDDDGQKAAYWTRADMAYRRYTALSGKIAAGSADLSAFNLPVARSSATDVCEYIAKGFSSGGGNLISAKTGRTLQDGRLVSFYSGYDSGSCAGSVVRLQGEENTDDEHEELQPDGAPGNEVGPQDIRIVPFRGKSYILSVVDSGPYDVVEPYKGHICEFSRTFTPTLVGNSSPQICNAFLDETNLKELPWSSDGVDRIPPARVGYPGIVPNQGVFDGVAVADLAGSGTRVELGHYTSTWTGGCGCAERGVAILKGGTMDGSDFNRTLLNLQNYPSDLGWPSCGGESSLVQLNGRAYIEQVSGAYLLDGHPEARALIGLVRGKFERICRLEQVPSYRPESP